MGSKMKTDVVAKPTGSLLSYAKPARGLPEGLGSNRSSAFLRAPVTVGINHLGGGLPSSRMHALVKKTLDLPVVFNVILADPRNMFCRTNCGDVMSAVWAKNFRHVSDHTSHLSLEKEVDTNEKPRS